MVYLTSGNSERLPEIAYNTHNTYRTYSTYKHSVQHQNFAFSPSLCAAIYCKIDKQFVTLP